MDPFLLGRGYRRPSYFHQALRVKRNRGEDSLAVFCDCCLIFYPPFCAYLLKLDVG